VRRRPGASCLSNSNSKQRLAGRDGAGWPWGNETTSFRAVSPRIRPKSGRDGRARRRERAAIRRAELDREYVAQFAQRVRELYPGCPPGREQEIAEHACRKYSGRVGRSAAAKALDEEAVYLAVQAHVRHNETNYDELLMQGMDRWLARDMVTDDVRDVLYTWRSGE